MQQALRNKGMFGKLTLDAVPLHEPIIVVTLIAIVLGGLGLVGVISYFGKWKWLWKEWLTSVDHKKIGVMYIIVAMVILHGNSIRCWSDELSCASANWCTRCGVPIP